ncbi:hypothetical protein NAEGRDRAFT_88171 [Naegleria gruberi]|uniref:Uncharacterized protein n=1 Tax=Naegleria gruberi TaxID=5762 RepID=D2VDZ2_NAEGR|nr:uncharacterized protein NAEGRDRAFT_88171 [Naegleria gruberi]EFC44983.1 hypothetical protein NAEGRDRAFT_88171 [Naegleria gruberi]|eukprot:XP_002677727.1 hypothetical protein NAEGRDRAFT_88171 [Naegleria gruberi strain NEG-M]
MLYEIEENLSTGDIVLFSTRSIPGRTFRHCTESKYCHVGIIVKLPKSDKSNYGNSENSNILNTTGMKQPPTAEHVYVLEAQVDYDGLLEIAKSAASDSTSTSQQAAINFKVKTWASLQRLSSKLYSGYYDLVSVRKLKYLHGKKGADKIQEELMDLLFTRDSNNSATEEGKISNILENGISFTIHPHYFQNFFRDSLFENGLIYASPVEDRQIIVSAYFTAFIYQRLGIFDMENKSLITKFTPFHFSEDSTYKLPFNKSFVMGLESPMYIYLDYEVFADQVKVENKPLPLPVTDFPIVDKIVRERMTFNESILGTLRSGDLIFTQEESSVGKAIRRAWNGSVFSRVGVIIRIQGQHFVYDIAPYYVSQEEAKIPQTKILEGRIQSLHSYIHSTPFTKVTVRKLENEGTNVSVRMQEKRVHVALEFQQTLECPLNKKIREVFDNIDANSYIPRIRFDISGVFSCVFVLLMLKQLRLINVSDEPADLLSYTPQSILDFKKLNGDYKLTDELTVLNAFVTTGNHKV